MVHQLKSGHPSLHHHHPPLTTMDLGRDLMPWESEHAKRVHVFKIPTPSLPSGKSADVLAFDETSGTGSKDGLAQHLAKMYYEISAAHNDRQFDRALEPWSSASPSFKFEVAYGGQYGGQQVVGLDEYLELGKQMFGGDPSLKVEVLDVTIQIDSVAGVAEAFANQALISSRLTRKSVCVTDFRRIDGKWRVVGGKNIKGEDGV